MKKVILYTTHCPKCEILVNKLKSKNIYFEEISDINIIFEKGFTVMPMLEADGVAMSFSEANDWINSQSSNKEDLT